MTPTEIKQALKKGDYLANDEIVTSVWAAMELGRPLLLEGQPGVGKTAVAKALAEGLGMEFIRLQMYEGLTDDKILYDYDYQKQLLLLEAVKPQLQAELTGMTANEALNKLSKEIDFYGEDFLIKRPILRAITSDKPIILVIDELDKASEEIEYMLYEFLENYSFTIPQLGTISCNENNRPIVFITSNGYRELSGALRRRCNYLYIKNKTSEEIADILKLKINVDEKLAQGVANCMSVIQKKTSLHYVPSLAEALDYTGLLKSGPRSKEFAISVIGALSKDSRDYPTIKKIINDNGTDIWNDNEDVEE